MCSDVSTLYVFNSWYAKMNSILLATNMSDFIIMRGSGRDLRRSSRTRFSIRSMYRLVSLAERVSDEGASKLTSLQFVGIYNVYP